MAAHYNALQDAVARLRFSSARRSTALFEERSDEFAVRRETNDCIAGDEYSAGTFWLHLFGDEKVEN